jgi:hypothetical protein
VDLIQRIIIGEFVVNMGFVVDVDECKEGMVVGDECKGGTEIGGAEWSRSRTCEMARKWM